MALADSRKGRREGLEKMRAKRGQQPEETEGKPMGGAPVAPASRDVQEYDLSDEDDRRQRWEKSVQVYDRLKLQLDTHLRDDQAENDEKTRQILDRLEAARQRMDAAFQSYVSDE